MRPENQLQSIQCGGSSFFLDISWLPFVLYVLSANPYQENFLERHSRQQNTLFDPFFIQPRRYSSSAYLSQSLQSQFTREVQSLTSSSLLIYSQIIVPPRTSPRPNIYLGLRPHNNNNNNVLYGTKALKCPLLFSPSSLAFSYFQNLSFYHKSKILNN